MAKKTVGSYEAKTNLPKLLEDVAKGEKVTITKHGVPVAVLVPVPPFEKRDVRSVIEDLRALRKGASLKGLSLRKLIEEGRRF